MMKSVSSLVTQDISDTFRKSELENSLLLLRYHKGCKEWIQIKL